MTTLRSKLADMPQPTAVTLTADSHLLEDFIITNDIVVDQPGLPASPQSRPMSIPVQD